MCIWMINMGKERYRKYVCVCVCVHASTQALLYELMEVMPDLECICYV